MSSQYGALSWGVKSLLLFFLYLGPTSVNCANKQEENPFYLAHIVVTGYSIFANSVSEMLTKSDIRNKVLQVIKQIIYVIFVTIMIAIIPFFAWLLIRFFYLKQLPISVAAIVPIILLLPLSSIVVRILKNSLLSSINHRAVIILDQVVILLILSLIRYVLVLFCIEHRKIKVSIVILIPIINTLYILLSIKRAIQILGFLVEKSYDSFIKELVGIQKIAFFIAFFGITILFRTVYDGQEKRWLAHVTSVIAIIALCSYFIEFNLENLMWLSVTYIIILYLRNSIILSIDNLIRYIPNYPKYSTTSLGNIIEEKVNFMKALSIFSNVTFIIFMPSCAAIYLNIFFNIFIFNYLALVIGYALFRALIIITLLMSLLILMIITIHYFFEYYVRIGSYINSATEDRALTFAKIAANAASVLLSLIFFFLIPCILGFEISIVFTVLGLVFSVLSYCAQDLIKDIIQGMIILYEGTIVKGDILYLELDGDNVCGKVENIGLRKVQLRADNGTLITVPCRKLGEICFGNKNRIFCRLVLNTSFRLETSTNIAYNMINLAFDKLRQNPEMASIASDLQIRGIADFTGFSYIVQYIITTTKSSDQRVRRAFNEILLGLFFENGISIPSPIVASVRSVPSVTTGERYPEYD